MALATSSCKPRVKKYVIALTLRGAACRWARYHFVNRAAGSCILELACFPTFILVRAATVTVTLQFYEVQEDFRIAYGYSTAQYCTVRVHGIYCYEQEDRSGTSRTIYARHQYSYAQVLVDVLLLVLVHMMSLPTHIYLRALLYEVLCYGC